MTPNVDQYRITEESFYQAQGGELELYEAADTERLPEQLPRRFMVLDRQTPAARPPALTAPRPSALHPR